MSKRVFENNNQHEPTVCKKDCACNPYCHEDKYKYTQNTKCYLVKPLYKKSVYEELIYTKMYDEIKVNLNVTKIWRYGEFYVDLTDSELKEIVELNEVELNKYSTEVICTNHLYDYDAEIIDIYKYDKKLQEKIILDVFEDIGNEIPYDDSELVDEHNWELNDTLYSIISGVVIDEVKSDDEI